MTFGVFGFVIVLISRDSLRETAKREKENVKWNFSTQSTFATMLRHC